MDPILLSIGTMLFTGGAAFGGVKVALNGTRSRVEDIRRDMREHSERLRNIESKVDVLQTHQAYNEAARQHDDTDSRVRDKEHDESTSRHR